MPYPDNKDLTTNKPIPNDIAAHTLFWLETLEIYDQTPRPSLSGVPSGGRPKTTTDHVIRRLRHHIKFDH